MNRDDIIRMALEAGFLDRKESSHMFGQSRFDEEICVEEYAVGEIVERFAALVAAEKDREIEELLRALEGMLDIVTDSIGVAGYHLNGKTADWREFPEINSAYAAIAKARGQNE